MGSFGRLHIAILVGDGIAACVFLEILVGDEIAAWAMLEILVRDGILRPPQAASG